jgi:hypothetical protein
MAIGKSLAVPPSIDAGAAVNKDPAEIEIHLFARQTEDSFDEPEVGY